jgi:hypothetical protein
MKGAKRERRVLNLGITERGGGRKERMDRSDGCMGG